MMKIGPNNLLLAFCLLFSCFSTACSNGSGGMDETLDHTGEQSEKSQALEPSQEAEQETNQVASEPVMVGGTFLVCAEKTPADEVDSQVIACRIENNDGDKRDDFSLAADDVAIAGEEEMFQSELASGEEANEWHWMIYIYGMNDQVIEVVAHLRAGEGDQVIALSTDITPRAIETED